MALDDHNINGEIEAEGFVFGKDLSLGGEYSYVVDRTNGLCFLVVTGEHSSTTSVNCENLKKTPSLKIYIETGKVSPAKNHRKRINE